MQAIQGVLSSVYSLMHKGVLTFESVDEILGINEQFKYKLFSRCSSLLLVVYSLCYSMMENEILAVILLWFELAPSPFRGNQSHDNEKKKGNLPVEDNPNEERHDNIAWCHCSLHDCLGCSLYIVYRWYEDYTYARVPSLPWFYKDNLCICTKNALPSS